MFFNPEKAWLNYKLHPVKKGGDWKEFSIETPLSKLLKK
jgi:hypothetical protein